MNQLPYDLDKYAVTQRRVATNGIELNVFEVGDGPLVILLHGFPECWAIWGPQVPMLLERGYKVLMPEQRGYGESDAPADVTAYDTMELAADIAGLVDAYNEEQAIVIGHDWGCTVAWHTAWLFPEKVSAVAGLSVPWLGRGECNELETLNMLVGNSYFYINDFQRDETVENLNKDHRKSLTLIWRGEMEMFGQEDDGTSFLDRIELDSSADCVSDDLLDYMISRYQQNGFEGPLNWYRNFQRTFERTEGKNDILKQPAMYLTGDKEWTNVYFTQTGYDISTKFSDLRIHEVTPGGHWLSQEVPEWVNGNIAKFLDTLS